MGGRAGGRVFCFRGFVLAWIDERTCGRVRGVLAWIFFLHGRAKPGLTGRLAHPLSLASAYSVAYLCLCVSVLIDGETYRRTEVLVSG